MIFSELRKQRFSVSWFAKQMGSDRSNMYRLLERQHLNSDFILRASKILNHNFFEDASIVLLESMKNQNDELGCCKTNNNLQ